MKIGVTSFHCSYNFGAILQAWAMQTMLENLGHCAEFVNYWLPIRIKNSKTIFAPFSKRGLATNLMVLAHYSKLIKKHKRFDEFRNASIKTSKEFYTSADEVMANPPCCDAFITGSDQVWNPNAMDSVYSLEFAKIVGAKKISYSPSFGVDKIPADLIEKYKYWLADYDSLSCREAKGCQMIKEICGRDSTPVLDPVMMIDEARWRNLAGERIVNGDYILVYILRRRAHMIKSVNALSKKHNLPVIVITGENPATYFGIKAEKVFFDAGPKEFVNLFANAKAVCTNSFHGTAFAALFGNPFFVYSHTREDYRASDLLTRLDCMDRLMLPNEPLKVDLFDFDAEKISKNLKLNIDASYAYLQKALS